MELERLSFEVDTDALSIALSRVEKLASSVSDLTKVISDLEQQRIESQRNETKLAKAEEATLRAKEKLRETEEKLVAARQKAIDIQEQQKQSEEKAQKQSKETGESISEVEKRLEKQRVVMKVLSGDTIAFADSLVQLNRGFTAGQASQLATLKLMGATSDQFKELAAGFEQINKLQGVNPFDKSAGNLNKMIKETSELKMVNDYLAKGLGLTKDQIIGLSRDIEAFNMVAKTAGLSEREMADGIEKMTAQTVIAAKELNALRAVGELAEKQAREQADAENTRALAIQKVADAQDKLTQRIAKEQAMQKYLDAGSSRSTANTAASFQVQGVPQDLIDSFVKEANAKEQSAKASREAAQAAAYLASMEEKLTTAVQETNHGLSRQQSDELVKIRQALKLSGASAEESAKKMALFEAALRQAASQDNARSMQHLSRAISVQMGDVVTSLASGMNPLLVFIQQGDQIRGALLNAKGDAAEMSKVMNTAAQQIVTSFATVAKIFGEFVFGAFTSAGDAIVGIGKKFTTWTVGLVGTVTGLSRLSDAVDVSTESLKNFEKAAGVVVGTSLMVLITLFVAASTAAYKMMKANTDLTASLVSNAASWGLTTTEVTNMALSMDQAGVSSLTFMNIFSSMAKEGNIAVSVIKDAAKAIAELERVGGDAADESVKKLSKIGDDPVKALSAYRIATGLVTDEQMRHIETLVNEGREIEAVQIAQETMVSGWVKQAAIMEGELNPLQQLWKDLKSIIVDVWDEITKFSQSPAFVKPLTTAFQTVAIIAYEVWYTINGIARTLANITAQGAAYLSGDTEHASNIGVQADVANHKAEQDREKTLKRLMSIGEEASKSTQANSQATLAALKKESDAERAKAKLRAELTKLQEKDDQKTMSRNEYIADQTKKLGDSLSTLNEKELQLFKNKFGKEWDDAHKQKKGMSSSEKEAKALDRYFERIMESARTANQNTDGIFEGLTKLEVQVKKTQDDSMYKKLSKQRQEAYENSMKDAIATEKKNLATELSNKLIGDADGKGREYYKTLSLINKLTKEGYISVENEKELLAALEKTTPAMRDKLRIEEELRKYNADVQKQTDNLNEQQKMIGMTAVEQEIANRQLAQRNAYLDAGNKLMQQMSDVDRSKMRPEDKDAKKLEFVKLYQQALDNITMKGQLDELKQFSDGWRLLIEQIDSMGASLTGAFGKIGTNIGNSVKSVSKLGATLDKNNRTLNTFRGSEEDRAKRVRKNTIEELGLYADSASAVKSLFKEKTTAYKALDAIEKAAHIARIGMMVAEMVMGKTAVANKIADDTAKNGSTIVSAGIDAVAGVIKAIASMPFPLNIAAGVATTAVMAGLLGSIGGSMKGSSAGSKPTYNTGTGTVFGDSSAKSESLSNSISLLEQANSLTQKYSPQMLLHLRNIDNSIGGLVNLLIRTGKIDSAASGVSFGNKQNYEFLSNISKALTFGLAGFVIKPLGNIVGSIFGKTKVTNIGNGITGGPQALGDILSNGFDASYFSDVKIKKSGLFGGSTKYRTYFSDADAELEQQITAVFRGVANSLISAGESLGGVESDIVKELNSFVVDIGKINLSGSTSEMQETLTNAFSAISDQIAKKIVPGLEEFQKVGEGYYETLIRVASNLESVNSWLDMLGANLMTLGISGVRASESVIALFGGIDEFSSATSDYYDKFYTDEEKNAKRMEQLTKVFGSMGISVPKTTKEYRDLVNSLDLTSSVGAEMYYTMIKVSDAFYEVKTAGEEAASTLKDKVYEAFTSSVDSSKAALEKQQQEYQSSVSNLQSIFDNLGGYIKELRGTSSTSDVGAARKLITDAITTGVIPESAKISDAYNVLKDNLSKTSYGSAFEKNKAYGLLANDLEALQKVTGGKLSEQQLLLDGVTKQIAVLDAQLEYAKKQYNLLSNINDTILGVDVAFDAMMEVFRKQASLQGISLDPVPAFASGGFYQGGLALVGEDGPELINFNQPGQVYNANQTANMIGNNSAVVEAIQNMNQNIELLRVEVRADVSHNAKVAKLLDRVVQDGESVLVSIKS